MLIQRSPSPDSHLSFLSSLSCRNRALALCSNITRRIEPPLNPNPFAALRTTPRTAPLLEKSRQHQCTSDASKGDIVSRDMTGGTQVGSAPPPCIGPGATDVCHMDLAFSFPLVLCSQAESQNRLVPSDRQRLNLVPGCLARGCAMPSAPPVGCIRCQKEAIDRLTTLALIHTVPPHQSCSLTQW